MNERRELRKMVKIVIICSSKVTPRESSTGTGVAGGSEGELLRHHEQPELQSNFQVRL